MKDLIHYDEWKDSIKLCNEGSNEVIKTQRITNHRHLTEAQSELYKYLIRKHECSEEPHESEIVEIYLKYIRPTSLLRYKPSARYLIKSQEDVDRRVHINARCWFRNTIGAFILSGYFGLQFRGKVYGNK